jgi:hypothetical protein
MSETTVEERVSRIAQEFPAMALIDHQWKEKAAAEIRAAVAAERERCAEVDPLSVRCPFPLCQSKVGEPCWNGDANYPEDGIHFSRFAAAIRKDPA